MIFLNGLMEGRLSREIRTGWMMESSSGWMSEWWREWRTFSFERSSGSFLTFLGSSRQVFMLEVCCLLCLVCSTSLFFFPLCLTWFWSNFWAFCPWLTQNGWKVTCVHIKPRMASSSWAGAADGDKAGGESFSRAAGHSWRRGRGLKTGGVSSQGNPNLFFSPFFFSVLGML